MRKFYVVNLFLILSTFASNAQVQFWSDSFEDAGSPSIGSRTLSIAEFKCASGFFKRTDGTDITWSGAFTNISGSKYFGAMDIDRGPSCGGNNTVSAAQTITWSGIDIVGKSNLSFKGFFGANASAVFQGIFFNDAANGFVLDYIIVEYRINGSSNWTKAISIYPNDGTATGGPLAVDTNGDMIGNTPVLTNALTELTANITGTGNTLDLRISLFVNNGAPGSVAFDNFRLFHTSTLPVTLQDFKARKENNEAILNWTTASEQHNKGFAIYRSSGDKPAVKIGEVNGNGTTALTNSYVFYDRQPLNGDNYYDLVQIDINGKETKLETKVLKFSLNKIDVALHPNPTSGKATVSFKAGSYSSAKLFGSNGQVLKTLTFNTDETEAEIDLSGLPKGIYFITLSGKNGKSTEKLVKK